MTGLFEKTGHITYKYTNDKYSQDMGQRDVWLSFGQVAHDLKKILLNIHRENMLEHRSDKQL